MQTVNIDPVLLDRIQRVGRRENADLAYFIDDHFMQFYKKGDLSSNHYWLYMPIIKGLPNTWRNSFHFCLDRMIDFEVKRGKKAVLIPIYKHVQE